MPSLTDEENYYYFYCLLNLENFIYRYLIYCWLLNITRIIHKTKYKL